MVFNTDYGKVNIEQKYLNLFKNTMQYDLTETEVNGYVGYAFDMKDKQNFEKYVVEALIFDLSLPLSASQS